MSDVVDAIYALAALGVEPTHDENGERVVYLRRTVMSDDLDRLEAIAKRAQEEHAASQLMYWSTWFEYAPATMAGYMEAFSPDVVIRLISRVREAERQVHPRDCMGCTRCT